MMLIIGLVFIVMVPLFIGFEKLTLKSGEGLLSSVSTLFLAIAIICIAIAVIIGIVSSMMKKPEINKDDYAKTSAVLINVPEYKEKQERVSDSDGDYHYRTVTYYYGDTVAEYQVNGQDFRTKVYNNKDNYQGKTISLYYQKEDPGFTRASLDINDTNYAWIPIVILGCVGGMFLFFAITFKIIQKKDKEKTASSKKETS